MTRAEDDLELCVCCYGEFPPDQLDGAGRCATCQPEARSRYQILGDEDRHVDALYHEYDRAHGMTRRILR